ncbi:ATP-dependent DNA helicase PIF1 [Ceratobasidium sp. AG-Ba]|nr:ATP-dependent DNA helicase PIF1 [Ceratobasidium sp. AG-Ba]
MTQMVTRRVILKRTNHKSVSNPTTPERVRTQTRHDDHELREQISPDARRIPQPQLDAPIAGPSNQQVLTNRQVAQRARRQREREAAQAPPNHPIPSPPPPPGVPDPEIPAPIVLDAPDVAPAVPEVLNPRQIAQRARRARERAEREGRAALAAQINQGQGLPQQPQQENAQVGGNGDVGNPEGIQNAQENESEDEQDLPAPQLEEAMEARAAARERLRQTVWRLSAQPRHNLGDMNIVCQHCGAYHWADEKLSKSRADNPVFGSCCREGRVQVPLTRRPPAELWRLYTRSHPLTSNFFSHIRQFNSALAFASMGVGGFAELPGHGPYVFKISGEVYHSTGNLQPQEGQDAAYAQLFVYDSLDEAANLRSRNAHNVGCDPGLMRELTGVIHAHHHYAGVYKQIWERTSNQPVQRLSMVIRQNRTLDPRRYNRPTSDELALIFPGEGLNRERDIIVHRANENGGIERISTWNPAYIALHYVLLLPYDPMPGPEVHFGTIFRACRLFQQFLVDIWAIIDQARLIWMRMNQATIRRDLYLGLVDALHTDQLVTGANLGTILASSYYGGARQLAEAYQDAMAIARYLGPPQFFVTMTANPNWPELKNALLPGQSPADRSDLAVRVFELKRRALLHDISKNHVLGRCIAHVFTIEFQKRGLPHMHLLVWVERASHLIGPDDVDEVISAELPDQADRNLYETVTTSMLHGPCGPNFPNAPCWDAEKQKCTQGYWPLKPWSPTTTMIPNSYPQYRRRNNGQTFTKEFGGQAVVFDNRSVVPHNPYLSRRYNCHINVETCSGINAIKYIFKYVYKGRDRVSIEIRNQHAQEAIDEIKIHLDARWVSPYEAKWRICRFSLHQEVPNIYRLQVHLPDQESIVFRGDDLIQDIVANRHDTMLTGYFKLNAHQNNNVRNLARSMVYQEIPAKFSWNKKQRIWKLRRTAAAGANAKGAIGRMYFVGPNQGPKFYLRLLLTVVKGATSFEELRTYRHIIHPTFQACCIARGLLEDDGEWTRCLEEASVMKTGHQLRKLFVVILTFGNPTDPLKLWNDYKQHLCDDLRHHIEHYGWNIPDLTDEQVYDYGLYLLEKLVQEAGSTMENVKLPKSQGNWQEYEGRSRLILEQIQLRQAIPEGAPDAMIAQLNPQQMNAFHQVYSSAIESRGQTFFLDGPAGTGKTFLYKALCDKLRSEGRFVICVASSGIASLLLPGGRTSHSRFNIPIQIHDASTCSIDKQSDLAQLIRQTKLIIWDEVPMQHRFCAEAFNRTCQDICSNPDQLFGGITVVFGGDFRQILPVIPHGEPEQIIAACLKRSPLWPQMYKLRLTENMRLQGDPEAAAFATFLLQVGEGASIQEGHSGSVEFDPHMHVASRAELIDKIYPNLSIPGQHFSDEFLQERTILAGRNDDVLLLNNKILDKFPGNKKVYNSADTVNLEQGVDNVMTAELSTEFLNSLNCASIPVSKLELKVGCPIMILRNLAPSQGICNGTRAVVTHLGQRVIEVRLLTGSQAGSTVFIPRITLSSSESDFGFVMNRRQFPIRLAFAMTINKSQGQSVKYVGLDFENAVFSHGQLYVAMSRCTSASRIYIFNNSPECVMKNVVYKSVLND